MSRTKREQPRIIKKRNYLVSFRANAGISQYKVAKEADIPQCRYNQIEAGKCGFLMNAKILRDLARVLNIPIDTIFSPAAVFGRRIMIFSLRAAR